MPNNGQHFFFTCKKKAGGGSVQRYQLPFLLNLLGKDGERQPWPGRIRNTSPSLGNSVTPPLSHSTPGFKSNSLNQDSGENCTVNSGNPRIFKDNVWTGYYPFSHQPTLLTPNKIAVLPPLSSVPFLHFRR